MPKVPLKKLQKDKEPEELILGNWRFKAPPLFYRVYKYDNWKARTGQNKEDHDQVRNPENLHQQAAAGANFGKPDNIENIEPDPEYSDDEDEYLSLYDWNSSDEYDDYNDDNGDGDDTGVDGGGSDDDSVGDDGNPRVVVVEAAVHAHF